MGKFKTATVVTNSSLGLLALGFGAMVRRPMILASVLYVTYQAGKAAYRKIQPKVKLTKGDYTKLFM
jgi:wyosine [tRNA(Phe)-imidazoG37] synthetase (radical SAM superfamily)